MADRKAIVRDRSFFTFTPFALEFVRLSRIRGTGETQWLSCLVSLLDEWNRWRVHHRRHFGFALLDWRASVFCPSQLFEELRCRLKRYLFPVLIELDTVMARAANWIDVFDSLAQEVVAVVSVVV